MLTRVLQAEIYLPTGEVLKFGADDVAIYSTSPTMLTVKTGEGASAKMTRYIGFPFVLTDVPYTGPSQRADDIMVG